MCRGLKPMDGMPRGFVKPPAVHGSAPCRSIVRWIKTSKPAQKSPCILGCVHITAKNAVCFLSMIHALSAVVLLVGDLFHPCNVIPVDCSRNGDMRHGGGG